VIIEVSGRVAIALVNWNAGSGAVRPGEPLSYFLGPWAQRQCSNIGAYGVELRTVSTASMHWTGGKLQVPALLSRGMSNFAYRDSCFQTLLQALCDLRAVCACKRARFGNVEYAPLGAACRQPDWADVQMRG